MSDDPVEAVARAMERAGYPQQMELYRSASEADRPGMERAFLRMLALDHKPEVAKAFAAVLEREWRPL